MSYAAEPEMMCLRAIRRRCAQGGHEDVLHGGSGDDVHAAEPRSDVLKGGSGDDKLIGGKGDDVLHGGSGDDVLRVGSGDDVLKGGIADDKLIGGKGDDVLKGGSADDVLKEVKEMMFFTADLEMMSYAEPEMMCLRAGSWTTS